MQILMIFVMICLFVWGGALMLQQAKLRSLQQKYNSLEKFIKDFYTDIMKTHLEMKETFEQCKKEQDDLK